MTQKSTTPSEKNRYLENREDGLKLLTQLISAKSGASNNSSKFLRGIEINIEKDFLELVTKYECPYSAKIYSDLQKVYEDIVNVVNFPNLENTFTVAVGGSFSAGKSRFLNAILFKGEDLLPTDTDRTTAIPTYLLSGEKESIFALNRYQHRIEIDEDALHAVSHAFNSEYGVSFSHILKLIAVEKKNIPYKNITFLDTPGCRNDSTDDNIAKEHLRTSDYLIWLVDIQNGTIPQTDVDFILNLDYEMELLVVLNKAENKTLKEIRDTVFVAKSNLEKNKVKFYDVIGFSSSLCKEYSPSGKVLDSFLSQADNACVQTELISRVNDIFEEFLSYQKSEIAFIRLHREVLNKGSVDMKIDDQYRASITEISKKKQKDLMRLFEGEKRASVLRDTIIKNIRDILTELKIKVSDGKTSHRSRKGINSYKENSYRFEAAFQCRDVKNLVSLENPQSIKGVVKKINAMGVIIKSNDTCSEAIIMTAEVLNKSGMAPEKIFQQGDEVTIQYITSKNCIIIV